MTRTSNRIFYPVTITEETFPVRRIVSPLTVDGYVSFVKLVHGEIPQGWVCTSCFKVVTESKQQLHAWNH